MTTYTLRENIHTYNNLTLCKVNYFETCWCKLNTNQTILCPYLLRYVRTLSNSNYFCTYHTIRKIIECFNSTIIYPKQESIAFIYTILTILLFIIGLIGNGLSIIILFHKTLRQISVYQNLIILCSLNILYLLTILIRHQNPYHKDLRDISPNICRIHVFSVALTGHLCSWQLVSTSIQRVYSLLRLQSQRHDSWKQTIMIFLLCILIPFVIFDGQLLFNYGLFTNRHICDENISYESKQFQRSIHFPYIINQTKNLTIRYYPSFSQNQPPTICRICILWNTLDTLIYAILPFCFIIISSIVIIFKICERRRSTQFLGGIHNVNSDNLSILLIILNCLFLLMIGPLNICLICQSLMKVFSTKIFDFLNQSLRLLQNSYHALSFLFYCVNGNKFRQSAIDFFQTKLYSIQTKHSTIILYSTKTNNIITQTTPTSSTNDLGKRLSTSQNQRTYLTINDSLDIKMKTFNKTFV